MTGPPAPRKDANSPSSQVAQFLFVRGSGSTARGQRSFTGDRLAAQCHRLGPPGPTSDPSPHLSTALVQVGKARHLVGGLVLTICCLQVVTPLYRRHSAAAYCRAWGQVATHQYEQAQYSRHHNQLPSPSKVALLQVAARLLSKNWSSSWLRQAIGAQEVSVRVVQDLRPGPHLSGNDVFDASRGRIHAQRSFKLV